MNAYFNNCLLSRKLIPLQLWFSDLIDRELEVNLVVNSDGSKDRLDVDISIHMIT